MAHDFDCECDECYPPKGTFFITAEVGEEVQRAVAKHGKYNSTHEAYGVLLEEVDEFFDEVKKQKADVSKENMRKELIQIAAVCVRAIQDLC